MLSLCDASLKSYAWYHTYIAQSFISCHNLKIKHSTKQKQIQNKINKQAIMGVLTVKVIKATNLADKDFVGKTDPYVQIELEQDNMVRVFLFFFFCLLTFYRR